ncbi:helix-turn-helix transcriptional regulator [Streptomyces albus]|uniref:helix-turn-helix transcriptional regulator n=1 Tax=Streptomyces albus TaxID=1888 RepID=UPI003F4D2009
MTDSTTPSPLPTTGTGTDTGAGTGTGRIVLPVHARRLPRRQTAAGALRALARTASPVPAAGAGRSPLAEALQGLGALSPAAAPASPAAPVRPVPAAGVPPVAPAPSGATRPAGGAPGPARRDAAAPRPGGSRTAPLRPAGLSPAESRVAALAAAGYCNREIARRLFITVSTVEQHLTKAYRKLGVASRADLPAPAWRGEEPGEPASYGRGRVARGNGELS